MEITVYKLELLGSTVYLDSIGAVTGIIESDLEEFGDSAVITKEKMTKEKYENLPEFGGY